MVLKPALLTSILAIVLAVGIGVAAALSADGRWRRSSGNEAVDPTNAHRR